MIELRTDWSGRLITKEDGGLLLKLLRFSRVKSENLNRRKPMLYSNVSGLDAVFLLKR